MAHEQAQIPLIADEIDLDSASIKTESLHLDNSAPTLFIWALTLTAGISGLLFGYDTGVISSTLVSIGSDLSGRALTTLDQSLITSCTSFAALIVSPITGLLADRLGRRNVIIAADVLFVIGTLWQALTKSVYGMILGRSVVGLAVGGASLVVPLYISELSPSNHRGRLVTLSILFITVGQMVAYLIGWGLSTTPHGWRWMVGLGASPAFIQFKLLFLMPETPRWLMKVGKTEQARKVLRKVYGKEAYDTVELILRAIDMEILGEEEISNERLNRTIPPKNTAMWYERLQNKWAGLIGIPGHRRALTIACLLQGLQQLCGFNSLMYFSATIFASLGFASPTLASLSVAIANFIFTIVAMALIDRVGRRRILLFSIPIMAIGLFLVAIAFAFLRKPLHQNTVGGQSAGTPTIWTTLILVSITIYVCGYAIGIGNVPWQQSELFPLSIRSLGSSLATATNWGSNFVVGLTFLPMMEILNPTWTFVAYACICIAGWLIIWNIYPETMGLGLEEVGDLLSDGWGVKRRSGRGIEAERSERVGSDEE